MIKLAIVACAVAAALNVHAAEDPFQSMGHEDMLFTENLPFRNAKALADAMKVQEETSGKGSVVDLGNGHYAIKIGPDQIAIGGLCNGQACSTPAMRMDAVPGVAEKFAALAAAPAPPPSAASQTGAKEVSKFADPAASQTPPPTPISDRPQTQSEPEQDPNEVGRDLAKLMGLGEDQPVAHHEETARPQGSGVIYISGADVAGNLPEGYTYIKIAATANNLHAPQFDSPPPDGKMPTNDPRPTRAARNK